MEGGGVKNCQFYLVSKKTTKRGGGGQKSAILRRHSLWTAPKDLSVNWVKFENEIKSLTEL